MREAVAYVRLSSKEQVEEPCRLHAQEEEIKEFCHRTGYALQKVFRGLGAANGGQIDTQRKQLAAALTYAQQTRAPLIIASPDRLTRDEVRIKRLVEACGVEIVAVSHNPGAMQAEMLVETARSEEETPRLSEPIGSDGAQAKKHRAGNPRNLAEAQLLGAAANKKAAAARSTAMKILIDEIRLTGKTTAREIAEALNARGEPTAQGRPWTISNVRRVLRSIDNASPEDQAASGLPHGGNGAADMDKYNDPRDNPNWGTW